MYKKAIFLLTILFSLSTIVLMFLNYQKLPNLLVSISFIYIKKILPFLVLSIFLSNLLLECNIDRFLNPYLYTFIMSFLTGAPTNSIIIKKLLDQKKITLNDANKLLACTNFNNPIFIINSLTLIFNNKIIALKILSIIIILNLILFLLFSSRFSYKQIYKETNYSSLSAKITSSINITIKSILTIYITIVLFYLITNLYFPQNNLIVGIIKGIFEMTQGINFLENIKTDIKIKEMLFIIFTTFSGFSIHIQISSIFENYLINYKLFYFIKIIIIILGIMLIFL